MYILSGKQVILTEIGAELRTLRGWVARQRNLNRISDGSRRPEDPTFSAYLQLRRDNFFPWCERSPPEDY